MREVPDQSTRVFSPRSPLPLLFLPPVPTSSTPFSHLLSFSVFLMSFSFLFSRWYWTLATPFTIYYLSKYDSRKFAIGFLCNGQKGSPPCGPSGLSSKMAFSCNRPFLHKTASSLRMSLTWPFLREAFSIVHMLFSLLVAFALHGAPVQVVLSARSSFYWFCYASRFCFFVILLFYYFIILLFYYFIILLFYYFIIFYFIILLFYLS